MVPGHGSPDRVDRLLSRLPFVRGKQAEPLPVVLDRKRIYVLPTRLGLLVGVLLLGMLLGALNYNNNAGLMLSFLLIAVVHNGVVLAHLGLSGLRVSALHADAVHAGETVLLRLRLEAGRRDRQGLHLRTEAGDEAPLDLAAGTEADVTLRLPTQRRGLMAIGRLKIATTRPLGLARAWSWWRPETRVLVYPTPERSGPALPGDGSDGAQRPRAQRHGEDTHHLRDYRTGDAPRQIAWKASARLDRPMVREYEAGTSPDVRLDWAALGGLPTEARIARLTRWVIEAEREGRRYRLLLPDSTLGPARGAEHRHACLRALALMPGGAP